MEATTKADFENRSKIAANITPINTAMIGKLKSVNALTPQK